MPTTPTPSRAADSATPERQNPVAALFANFPYGAAALAFLLLALLSGAYILANPTPKRTATITFWTFAKPHYEAYQPAIKEFERTHPGVKVDMQLVSGDAVTRRLRAAFWANLDVPDMVECEISAAGSFFRGSLDSVGFVDLTDRIEREGLKEKLVESRFAPYTTRGRIFGLPHDVHPVMLAYRRDLFEKHDIKVEDIKTWDDFVQIGRRVTKQGERYLLEADEGGGGAFEALLFQRGGGYFDAEGNCTFDNEKGIENILQYTPMVAGPNRIASSLGWGATLTKGVEDGYVMTVVAPDWRSKGFENDIGSMKGKMGLMPLPAIEPGGRRTSTWGGTMMGITKAAKDKDLSWELAKFLYLQKEDLADRFAGTNIVPPLKAAWDLPEFKKPNAYYGGQAVGTAYAALAPEVPAQYGSPFIELAKGKYSQSLIASVAYYKRNGDKGFEEFVRKTVKGKADEVRKVMARTPFLARDKAKMRESGEIQGAPLVPGRDGEEATQ